MKDVIVTTPKTEMKNADREAQECIESGDGFYFRRFWSLPKGLDIGSKVFYVEDGYIRGYGIICDIIRGPMTCKTTGREWGPGFFAVMKAESWKWIKPQAMRGFQGFRYFKGEYEIVGDWLDVKPEVLE